MEVNLAWAIGLFEGEGTILIRKRPEDQIALSLSSTDEDVVRAFNSTMGCGKTYGPYKYGDQKPYWKWNLDNGEVAIELLAEMLPFFSARRATKAIEAITRYKARKFRPHYTVSRKGMGGRPTHQRRRVRKGQDI